MWRDCPALKRHVIKLSEPRELEFCPVQEHRELSNIPTKSSQFWDHAVISRLRNSCESFKNLYFHGNAL